MTSCLKRIVELVETIRHIFCTDNECGNSEALLEQGDNTRALSSVVTTPEQRLKGDNTQVKACSDHTSSQQPQRAEPSELPLNTGVSDVS